jgi:hypothetical protein
MTWIKTIPYSEADEKLRDAIDRQRKLYPRSTASRPASPDEAGSIVASHSLIPDASFHAFATFGRSCPRTCR